MTTLYLQWCAEQAQHAALDALAVRRPQDDPRAAETAFLRIVRQIVGAL